MVPLDFRVPIQRYSEIDPEVNRVNPVFFEEKYCIFILTSVGYHRDDRED